MRISSMSYDYTIFNPSEEILSPEIKIIKHYPEAVIQPSVQVEIKVFENTFKYLVSGSNEYNSFSVFPKFDAGSFDVGQFR